MKFNEIKKVNITVTQADIEQMIRDKAHAHDASIVINSIEFERKLKPAPHIAVSIDADYGQAAQDLLTEPEPEEQLELPVATEEVEEDDVKTESISDIFGG